MKTLVFVAAALTGCAVYSQPAPYVAVTPVPYAYAPAPPAYFYGNAVYPYRSYPPVYGYVHPRRFNHVPPRAFAPYVPRYGMYGPHWGRGLGDQDRDGIPNRYDRDRDGDGVPNRFDRRPGNPYWR